MPLQNPIKPYDLPGFWDFGQAYGFGFFSSRFEIMAEIAMLLVRALIFTQP